jgi:four helix bundle protein
VAWFLNRSDAMEPSRPRDLCERTFLFSCEVVALCLELAKTPGAHRQIAGQLLRAGTSVGSNTEDAKAAFTRREFACKNSMVLREAREARFWLRLTATTGLLPPKTVEPLLAEANELVGIFIATVKKARQPRE